ncbi:MAG: hypothetical protein RLZZ258_1014, partial [Actinomycetota bacterium]
MVSILGAGDSLGAEVCLAILLGYPWESQDNSAKIRVWIYERGFHANRQSQVLR